MTIGRDGCGGEGEQLAGAARWAPDRRHHRVVHDHRAETLGEPLDEEGQPSLDRRRLGADEEGRQQRDEQHERRVLHRRPLGEHDHERERDRERSPQRRPKLDQLAGCDRAADERERRPLRAGVGELGAEGNERASADAARRPGRTASCLRRPVSDRAPVVGEVPEPGRAGARLRWRDLELVHVFLVTVAVHVAAAFDRRDEGASTQPSLNCVPEPLRSSSNAVSWVSARRYERVDVMASNASATWMIAGSTSAVPLTAAVAASVVVSPATGARKSIRRSSSTETNS